MKQVRPTLATVDLSAIVHNVAHLRRYAPGAALCGVVKGNAYGHGLLPVARTLVEAGCEWLGVALVEEGAALRAGGITTPILVVGGALHGGMPDILDLGLTPVVSTAEDVTALADAAGGRAVNLHIEVDTGMARLGIATEDLGAFLSHLAAFPHLRVDGLMTHFAMADVDGAPFNAQQAERFRRVQEDVSARLSRPRWVHWANSPGVVSLPHDSDNLLRCGLTLYGQEPMVNRPTPGLRPAMRWATQPVALRSIGAGTPVSYGCRWVAQRPSRIATLPVGYADGYPRALSSRAQVLLRGRRAPVIGTVCMDLCMIDVTDIPDAALGDDVVLLGAQGHDAIGAHELAGWANTISYEILCGVSARVPRLYTGPGGSDRL